MTEVLTWATELSPGIVLGTGWGDVCCILITCHLINVVVLPGAGSCMRFKTCGSQGVRQGPELSWGHHPDYATVKGGKSDFRQGETIYTHAALNLKKPLQVERYLDCSQRLSSSSCLVLLNQHDFDGFVNLSPISKCHSPCKLIIQEQNEVEDGLVICPASAHFRVCTILKLSLSPFCWLFE